MADNHQPPKKKWMASDGFSNPKKNHQWPVGPSVDRLVVQQRATHRRQRRLCSDHDKPIAYVGGSINRVGLYWKILLKWMI
jgi:hypothetical protein